VFCHGQLYVAVSRTSSRNNIVCLVQPERMINGVPHVHNVVYPEFIQAATGKRPACLDLISNPRPTDNKGSSNDPDPDPDKD
ncbi:unnamed protein product, partial [Ectocarpus sp. 13 AM-2016]